MSEEQSIDIEQELNNLLTKVQPNLQDVIKRSFTNVALQLTKNGEQVKPETLEDTSYFAKHTQVIISHNRCSIHQYFTLLATSNRNLTRLELVKSPTFHIQNVSLDLKAMSVGLRCSLGEVCVKGLYSAFNENLYNLIPVMSEGHVLSVSYNGFGSRISLANMVADVNLGLVLEDDAFAPINPGIEFLHDEVVVKLSWPSPQKNGGYEFITTEQLAKHIDDLPLTAAISLPLFSLLRSKLQHHIAQALRQATSISDVMCCNPSLLEAYSEMVDCLAQNGNKVIDMILINMRRTLLQSRKEVIEIPPIHATFMHKIGTTSHIGKFDTEPGWVKNLATINRVSDVSVSRPDPTRTCFRVILRIKDLQIGYEQYRIKAALRAGGAGSGRLAAGFSRVSLHVALTIGARYEPYAQLDDLRVQCAESMDLHVTGLGPFSVLTPLISAWTRGACIGHAAPAIGNQLQHELHKALAEVPLWDLLHNKQ